IVHHRPLSSTLFPYTTLFRSLVAMALVLAGCGAFFRPRPAGVEATRSPMEEAPRPPAPEPPKLVEQLTRVASELSELQNVVAKRSEEHTSELQSRGHLVCRLL